MLWHLVSGFLYAEMGLVVILMLPLVSSTSWARLFRSRWAQTIANNSKFYFNFFVVCLVAVLVEAIRNTMNYRNAYLELKAHPTDLRPETESHYLMRMFRAQRNLHISGFALFTWFVFRLLVSMFNEHAQLKASQDASIRQARNAAATAEQLLQQQEQTSSTTGRSDEGEDVSQLKKKLTELTDKLESECKEHKRTKADLTALKSQAKQTSAEYDRLADECKELQHQLDAKVRGSSPDKKDD